MLLIRKIICCYFAICIIFTLSKSVFGKTPAPRPRITHISKDQIKDIGETVSFNCTAQNTKEIDITWVKRYTGKKAPFYSFASFNIKDTRFSVRYTNNTNSSTYTLQIKDIQEKDAGTYDCEVYYGFTVYIKNSTLFVRRPPAILSYSTPYLSVEEDSDVEMECYASGSPKPIVTWRREYNAILPTNSTTFVGNILKIKSVKKKDRGTYYCTADNGARSTARRNINLNVEFPPHITVPRPRQGQALQYDVYLVCHIEAYPPPAIVWLKDGIQILNTQNYTISHFGDSDSSTNSTLGVLSIEKWQYGDYVCKAVNKLGEAEAKVNLFETIIPICPPTCNQDAEQLEKASLDLAEN